VSIEKQLGEWVDPGTEFARIIDTSLLRVEGLIPASANRVKLKGQSAVVRLTTDRGVVIERQGKVVFVGVNANPVNSKVSVWIEFENSDKQLTPGLRVEASIDTAMTAAREP
jgi:hypothetical protein